MSKHTSYKQQSIHTRTSPQQGYKQSDKQYWDLLVSDRQQEQQVTSMV